jgi:hypothetical protein
MGDGVRYDQHGNAMPKRDNTFAAVGAVVLVVLFGIYFAVTRNGGALSPLPVTAAAAQPDPPAPTEVDPPAPSIAAGSFSEALAATLPLMADSRQDPDAGALLLARWIARNQAWAHVATATTETTTAKVLKDSAAERGKRMCVSGSLVQIQAEVVEGEKWFGGILMNYGGNVVRFIALGSSGELVADSPARLCGVATGRHSYNNTLGGSTNAIMMVGMFDLPENRSLGAPPPARQRASAPKQEQRILDVTVRNDGNAKAPPATAPAASDGTDPPSQQPTNQPWSRK